MDKDRLKLFQKYVEILDLARDSYLTLQSEAVERRVKELEIEPNDWQQLKVAFQDYHTRGKTYHSAGNYPDAITEFEVAISLNPNDDKTLLGLAEAHASQWVKSRSGTDKRKAIEYADRVLKVKPDSRMAVKIITELKNAPFQPWIPYKTWWQMTRWAFVFLLLGGGYWFYAQNKEAIHAYISKVTTPKSKRSLPTDTNFDLGKVVFVSGSTELNPQAQEELDKLARYLQSHRTIAGEIACHTDNSGYPIGNAQISETRAMKVFNYLVGKGVAREQLTYKGYGDTRPLIPNTTEENRQKNRRVEFVMRKR